jgi:hypothetical protein
MTDGATGALKALFFYANETIPENFSKYCPKVVALDFTDIAVGIAVETVGKVAESLVDAAAAKMQPEATILDLTIPIPGFFNEKGEIAVAGGCLIFHNSATDDPEKSTLLSSMTVFASYDKSAFRFRVNEWRFTRFLKTHPSGWFQKNDAKDFLLKIEFLSPGSSGLGNRSVYVEHAFIATSVAALRAAFVKGQDLPWFAAPAKPSGLPLTTLGTDTRALFLPLNIRITAVETSLPNQFAKWVQEVAKDKKSDISTAVKDIVRSSLDEDYAAGQKIKKDDLASTAFAAYKVSWDEATLQRGLQPKESPESLTEAQQVKFAADTLSWQAAMTARLQVLAAKQTLAKSAFASAALAWPGELPAITIP